MARILSYLLLLMLPAVSFAGAADGLVPAGSLSNALALVEANRISRRDENPRRLPAGHGNARAVSLYLRAGVCLRPEPS